MVGGYSQEGGGGGGGGAASFQGGAPLNETLLNNSSIMPVIYVMQV